MCLCAAELYMNSCKFDSAFACIQEAASYNPVSHAVSYMVRATLAIILLSFVMLDCKFLFTYRISEGGNGIASVRLLVCFDSMFGTD